LWSCNNFHYNKVIKYILSIFKIFNLYIWQEEDEEEEKKEVEVVVEVEVLIDVNQVKGKIIWVNV
tara:strand:+ start:808 stop:1002 length:195 start_codon:yes stop_codon:yes gene_type:complete